MLPLDLHVEGRVERKLVALFFFLIDKVGLLYPSVSTFKFMLSILFALGLQSLYHPIRQ